MMYSDYKPLSMSKIDPYRKSSRVVYTSKLTLMKLRSLLCIRCLMYVEDNYRQRISSGLVNRHTRNTIAHWYRYRNSVTINIDLVRSTYWKRMPEGILSIKESHTADKYFTKYIPRSTINLCIDRHMRVLTSVSNIQRVVCFCNDLESVRRRLINRRMRKASFLTFGLSRPM